MVKALIGLALIPASRWKEHNAAIPTGGLANRLKPGLVMAKFSLATVIPSPPSPSTATGEITMSSGVLGGISPCWCVPNTGRVPPRCFQGRHQYTHATLAQEPIISFLGFPLPACSTFSLSPSHRLLHTTQSWGH